MRYRKERNLLPSAVNKIVVLKVLRNEILRLGHPSTLSAHLGIHKPFDRISSHFFASTNVAVKTFVRSCNISQKLKRIKFPNPSTFN